MTDLFADKALEYDHKPVPQQISEGVSAAMRARMPFAPDWVVLDFGAGTGLLTGKLAPHVARVLAVDVSPAMLEQLAAKPELQGKVEPFCQDLLAAPLGRQADAVVSAMALHHVEDTAGILRALLEHLKPGGHFALADLDVERGDFHPQDVTGVFHHGFDRARLQVLLEQAGFVEVAIDLACELDRDDRHYSVFLATARRPGI